MTENNTALDRETRLKRLRMRAWRRGMKEMDLILGGFVDREGPTLTDADMDAMETLMNRQDQRLFLWASGAGTAPEDAEPAERAMMDRIRDGFDR